MACLFLQSNAQNEKVFVQLFMQVNIGDKMWMYVGPVQLVVGHIVDQSPCGRYIGVSPVPYAEFKKMKIDERAKMPMSWCPLDACSYVAHLTYQQLQEMDEAIDVEKSKTNALFNMARA